MSRQMDSRHPSREPLQDDLADELEDVTFSQHLGSPTDTDWSISSWYGDINGSYVGQPNYDYFSYESSNQNADDNIYNGTVDMLQYGYYNSQSRLDHGYGESSQPPVPSSPLPYPASITPRAGSSIAPVPQHVATSRTARPPQTANNGRRGRRGHLPDAARQDAAKNRLEGSCLYHITRKIKCPRPLPSDSAGICSNCAQKGRLCHRLSHQCKLRFLGYPQCDNNPLLAQARTFTLEKQLRFSMKVRYPNGVDLPFEMDHIPVETQDSDESPLSESVPGKIGDEPFKELVESMARQAPISVELAHCATQICDYCHRHSSSCTIQRLLESVQMCVSLHLFLQCLVGAELRAIGADQNAAKCFIITLASHGIKSLRSSIKSSMDQCFKIIQTHNKVHADISYRKVVTALVALCKLLRAIAQVQNETKTGKNTLMDAILGSLPMAEEFAEKLEELTEGFFAVADPLPDSEEFRQLRVRLDGVLASELTAKLLIWLEASGSESSLREEGSLPLQVAQSRPTWGPDVDGRSRIFPAQSVRSLFARNRPSTDARRTRHGSRHASSSGPDSESGGFHYKSYADSPPKSPVKAGSSTRSTQAERTTKRERSDSLHLNTAKVDHKKSNPPR